MRIKFSLVISLLVIVVTNYTGNNTGNVDGLTVKFRKITEDYVRSGGYIPIGSQPGINIPAPEYADEGWKFVKLKLTLKNEGYTDCIFDFAEVYLSTEQDSLYRSSESGTYFTGTKTKIKPGKEMKKTIFFVFPDKSTPKELFIEDKRFKVIEED